MCRYGLISKINYLVGKVSYSTGYTIWTTVLKKKSEYNMHTHKHICTLSQEKYT